LKRLLAALLLKRLEVASTMFRPALLSDLSQIIKIENSVMPEAWCEELLRDELTVLEVEREIKLPFVVERDGKILGYIFNRLLFDEHTVVTIAVH